SSAKGAYHFGGLGPGAYQARVNLIGNVADQTAVLTIANADVVARDTLDLTSTGALTPVPNPCTDTVAVIFDVPTAEFVDLRVRDLKGTSTRVIASQAIPAGQYRFLWDGRDDAGHPVAGTLYWLIFQAGYDLRAQLLFR